MAGLTEEQIGQRQKTRKILNQMGLPIPKDLQKKTLHRVRDRLGTITVVEQKGVIQSPAASTVRQFEENIGNRSELVSALEAISETLPEPGQKLLEMLRDGKNNKKSLARLLAESGTTPTKAMNLYSLGCVELGKVQAAILAHKNLPQVVRNLNRHALSEAGDICQVCVGTGQINCRAGTKGKGKQKECPQCQGTGTALSASPLKKFATEAILDITGQSSKGGVNVTTNVGVRVDAATNTSDILAKIVGGMDQALYRRLPESTVEVLEAEVIDVSSNSN